MSGMKSKLKVKEEFYELFSEVPNSATYLAEAEFGLTQLAPFLDPLKTSSRVLEVGSGPCIALAAIARARPDLMVEGIEPMSGGFAHFRGFINKMQTELPNMRLFRGGYEEFPTSEPWDLIFLVNVFEHLPDWRYFLEFLHQRLALSGTCVILCPNYGFPYEAHFRIPVIGNKEITKRFFAKRIADYERQKDVAGLYESLNFVKLCDVRAASKNYRLSLEVDCSVVRTMVDRLDSEPEFADRQKVIAPFARILRKTGLLEWLLTLRSFQDRLPYMKLILRKE